MKNRTFRNLLSSRRSRKRGVSRLFVLGAAFAASTAVNESTAAAVQVTPPQTEGKAAATQGAPVSFNIPAGPLRDVIVRFEQATGLRVVVAMDGIGDIQSPGVSGVLTPTQALEALLSGTSVS